MQVYLRGFRFASMLALIRDSVIFLRNSLPTFLIFLRSNETCWEILGGEVDLLEGEEH